MKLNGKQFCDECKKEIIENEDGSYNDCLWLAKDGREYCDTCYYLLKRFLIGKKSKKKWIQIRSDDND